MPRPEPASSRSKLASDSLIVQPYTRSICITLGIAAIFTGLVFVLTTDRTVGLVAVVGIVVLTANVIGYLLILAKQVESVHRMNSRLDQLLESSGQNEYQAGIKQGRSDRNEELHP